MEKEVNGYNRVDSYHSEKTDHIAENYWHIHCQPRDAWTHELDIRPWIESF